LRGGKVLDGPTSEQILRPFVAQPAEVDGSRPGHAGGSSMP